MTKEELKNIIEHPLQANQEYLTELLQLSQQYPYCAPLQTLIILQLHQINDLRFSSELHERALTLPDLRRLYDQLNSSASPILHSPKETQKREKSGFDLIDSFLEHHPEDSSEIEELLDTPVTPVVDMGSNKKEGEDAEEIINAFLSLGDQAEAIKIETPKETIAPLPQKSSEAKGKEDELFTETLAKLYIKQGKYERAERTLSQIYLEFPQKSGYFAEQLDFLRRLIKINEYKSGKDT